MDNQYIERTRKEAEDRHNAICYLKNSRIEELELQVMHAENEGYDAAQKRIEELESALASMFTKDNGMLPWIMCRAIAKAALKKT